MVAVLKAASSLVAAAGNQLAEIRLHQLRVGSELRSPIYDDRNILLLAPGRTINERFLEHLYKRRLSFVRTDPAEVARLCAGVPQGSALHALPARGGAITTYANKHSDGLDQRLLLNGTELPPQQAPFARTVQSHVGTAYDSALMETMTDNCAARIQQVDAVYDSLLSGSGLDMAVLEDVADRMIADFAAETDLFNCLGINPFAQGYPARHGLHTSMLALAIGTTLQLDRLTLKELIIGCLLHESGMKKIKPGSFETDRILDQVSFLEITKHPVYVFDMLLTMEGVSNRSAFIAYQIHERCDGSGYPRGRDATQIHFLSRVAAVADVYVALVSPRPHRPAMLPYKAMEQMLRDAHAGLFDKAAVRALLTTLSQFPIGSFVELSDGRRAGVTRATGNFQRPAVETYEPYSQSSGEQIVLSERPELNITRPLASRNGG